MAIDRLSHQLSSYLGQVSTIESPILVATAQLELAQQPLHVQISDFARNCTDGITRIAILPLFLIPGVHVMEDIPAEVEIAAQEIANSVSAQSSQRVELTVLPFLGEDPDFANLFAQNRSGLPTQTIILAHGSRRAGGNAIVEHLASSVNLTAAYWSVAPSLTDRVAELVATGATEIGILPYFLFAGGITDAIAQSVAQLREQFPQVELILGEPMGNSPELVATIAKILASSDTSPN
jgi:sirohydrochlorin ferrochelatase